MKKNFNLRPCGRLVRVGGGRAQILLYTRWVNIFFTFFLIHFSSFHVALSSSPSSRVTALSHQNQQPFLFFSFYKHFLKHAAGAGPFLSSLHLDPLQPGYRTVRQNIVFTHYLAAMWQGKIFGLKKLKLCQIVATVVACAQLCKNCSLAQTSKVHL